jgi:hypothetical protein
MPAGALLAGLFAPLLIQRLGSGRVAAFGLIGIGAGVLLVPYAGSWLGFAAVMLVVGGIDALVDVGQNAHGFRVQRLYGRSIVNALHGLWSVGAVVGGLMGSAAAGLAIPLEVHLAVSAVVFSLAAFACSRVLLPGPEDAERTPVDDGTTVAATGAPDVDAAAPDVATSPAGAAGAPVAAVDPAGASGRSPAAATGSTARAALGRPALVLAALGVLAVCGAVVEDAGASWGALYLRTDLGAGALAGGLAFVALQVAMTAGRLTGDRAVDRFGQRGVARAGGLLVAAGMGAALALPSVPMTLLGFALAGLGVATLVPAAMHAADELPGVPHGVGLTVVSWLLRVGFLLSPPVVGLVADAAGLRVGLLGVVLAGLGVLLFGRVLVGRPARG